MLPTDHEITIVSGLRYALPRMTSVVGSVASTIEDQIESISAKSLMLIRDEITEALSENHAGPLTMQVERWEKCRSAINDELQERHRETMIMS